MERKPLHNVHRIGSQRYGEIRVVAEKLMKKHRNLFASILISGHSPDGLAEVLLLVDDFNNVVTDPQVSEAKISASQLAYEQKLPLKFDAMLSSVFWDGMKTRDEPVMQLARGSVVVHDNGFFLPMQDLLVTGKIRPSKESVRVYFVKAEQSMRSSGQHVSRAVLDLYWAVTDSAHAAVMIAGITPPSPKELVGLVKDRLVAGNLVHARCAEIIARSYDIAKKIMHKEVFEIAGREFDSYLADADFFVKEMDEFIQGRLK
jgi:uncharacterized protein (UPF0332 family)